MLAFASRLLFGIAGVVLMACAAALIVLGLVDLIRSGGALTYAVLDAISSVVIAIAVFDVAKYLIEEEVVRERQMRQAGEARRSLTRFVATVIIALLLEGLVTLFKTARADVSQLIFPTLLIAVGALLIVALGLYLRLSATIEQVADESGDGE
jgi:hypothetical protein